MTTSKCPSCETVFQPKVKLNLCGRFLCPHGRPPGFLQCFGRQFSERVKCAESLDAALLCVTNWS